MKIPKSATTGEKEQAPLGTESPRDWIWCSVFSAGTAQGRLAVATSHALVHPCPCYGARHEPGRRKRIE